MSEPRRKLTISVPKLPPSMEAERPALDTECIEAQEARVEAHGPGISETASPYWQASVRPDLKAWEEARNAATRRHLTQVEQDEKR